uniref:ATP synthase CF1 epsilon subunit n=1 Tax=Cyanidium sp. THAL103 TaxID=3027999 RepID=A0A9Y1MYG4_9RHOD|nr:ATP synthase CF1 epsilon subunit [Cyanidium sp. THAL103]
MSLKVKVITPDRIVWDISAEEIILPSSTGQLGILNNHAPLLTALDVGVIRVKRGDFWLPLVLFGGIAEINNNNVTILVNGAEEADNIDLLNAEKMLNQSIQSLNSAKTSKEKIEAIQNVRRFRARVQAAICF